MPGSASPDGERRAPAPRPRRALSRTLALAVAPLCLVAAVGLGMVLVDARHVHRDLQRMFEELREVSLTRSLLDELRGIEQWVQALPEGSAATNALALNDLRQHLDRAYATFARFTAADDPSRPPHDSEENAALDRVRDALAAIRTGLEADQPLGTLRPPLQLALHGAGVLGDTVGQETRAIGDGLDRRSERLVDLLSLLAVAGLATILWLGVLLRRRVLLPLHALHQQTTALGSGQAVRELSIGHDDEFGALADAFRDMAQQVRRAREDLESRVEARSREVLRTARLAELGTLSAGIAHEINNPLASIATCAEGLLRELSGGGVPDPQHTRDYLQIIRKEAMRTRDITTRLLTFARQDPGRRVPVVLADELGEVAALFEHQFAAAEVTFELDGGDVRAAILGDPAEWRQVLFNLLRNALDASPGGTTIRAEVRDLEDAVELTVHDQGPGFRPQDQEQLFEPFFTTKEPGKGTGLGLAIAHRIVTGHGGSIAAENRSGGGATFRVRVPRDRSATT